MANSGLGEFPANVNGSVAREYDYETTVNSAEGQELEVTQRLTRIRVFSGVVASQEVFEAVAAVDGVSALEKDRAIDKLG